MPKITLTYEKAMAELEAIVSAVENGQLEIDQLAPKIKRAQALLAHCQGQLNQVKTDLESLLSDEQE